MATYKALYTKRLVQKEKRWQDGLLEVAKGNSAVLLSLDKEILVSGHVESSLIAYGAEFKLDEYLIQIDEEHNLINPNSIFPQRVYNNKAMLAHKKYKPPAPKLYEKNESPQLLLVQQQPKQQKSVSLCQRVRAVPRTFNEIIEFFGDSNSAFIRSNMSILPD